MEPLSRDFLLARGYCCNLGCRNCPYEGPNNVNNGNRICSRLVSGNQANDEDSADS